MAYKPCENYSIVYIPLYTAGTTCIVLVLNGAHNCHKYIANVEQSTQQL